jgi:hypothetical protein
MMVRHPRASRAWNLTGWTTVAYLLLPEQLLGAWRGASLDDYERACAASDNWLNTLPVGDGIGLLLGGDPGMALAVPDESDLVVIRWLFANDEHELVAFALLGEGVVRTEPDFVFDNPDGRWRMFNATLSGTRANHAQRVSLPIGRVRVRTVLLESGRNAAIVHRFSIESEPDAGPDHAPDWPGGAGRGQ